MISNFMLAVRLMMLNRLEVRLVLLMLRNMRGMLWNLEAYLVRKLLHDLGDYLLLIRPLVLFFDAFFSSASLFIVIEIDAGLSQLSYRLY